MIYAEQDHYLVPRPEFDDKKVLEQLGSTYRHEREATKRATELAENEVVKYVQGLVETAQAGQAQTPRISGVSDKSEAGQPRSSKANVPGLDEPSIL